MTKRLVLSFSEEAWKDLEALFEEDRITERSRSAFFVSLVLAEKRRRTEATTKRGPGRPRKEEEEEIANIPHPAELQNAWGTVTGKKPWEVSLLTRSEYDDVLAMNPLVKWPENPTTIEEYNRDRSLWTGRLIPLDAPPRR